MGVQERCLANLPSFLQTPGAHEPLSRRLVNMFMMIGLSVIAAFMNEEVLLSVHE